MPKQEDVQVITKLWKTSIMKKSLKQFIFEKLDNGEYITDDVVYNFTKKESSLFTAQEYIRQWKRLKSDREFCNDREILGVEKGRRCYLVEFKEGYYKIGKEFYNEIYPKFQKVFSDKKYYFKGNELYNVKEISGSFLGFDLIANWKDREDNNKEKLGKFYLKDLETVEN